MSEAEDSGGDRFEATRWSLVKRAQEDAGALGKLCEAYWQPVFRFLWREGRSKESAEELTQAFFASLLEKGKIGAADPARGRFRSYVLGSVKHFLADERKAAARLKRGGGKLPSSLDGETMAGVELEDTTSAPDDAVFDREWAFAVLERSLTTLENEWVSQEKGELFAQLKPWLTGGGGGASKEDAAKALGMNAEAFKVAVHRMRRRFRKQVREEIGQTVEGEDAIGEELRYLLEVVSREG